MQSPEKNKKKYTTTAEDESAVTRRIITGLVVAGVIIPSVWFLPILGFAALFGSVCLLAAWEWTNLSGVENKVGRGAFCGALLIAMATYKWWLGLFFPWIMWPALAWWLAVAIAMRQIPEKLLKLRYPTAAKLAAGFFVLLTAWMLFIWLRVNFGAAQLLYLLVLIALADIAAYYFGKNWGFSKLLPEISPGKTLEGLYGALGATLILALSVGSYFYLFTSKWSGMVYADFVLLSLITVLISVSGDLFESLMKRLRGVKDSGDWLPGHGGVLDRIDSLLAAVPMFYVGCTLREIFFQ